MHLREHLPRCGGFALLLLQAREAEVEHLHVVIVTHHNVVGLDVSMRDAGGVRGAQDFRHLLTEQQERVQRVVFGDYATQRAARDQL
jgi:hypothetical protein